ncbi:hypothetical protein FOMPIDRAFT_1078761, partial [Fomitopsis schrenkii]
MTDFNSQGRTRPYNVVDLQNCKNHQSVYTCLSRGSTYQGTIIVQGFDHSKFMGGVTGWLCQEFRELELLDEITRLKYEGNLSPKVEGATRAALIHSYRTLKGGKYVPKTIHGALKWSEKDPFEVEDPYKEAEWELVKHTKGKNSDQKLNANVEADANTDPSNNLTRDALLEAKYTGNSTSVNQQGDEPLCFTWNEATYSCAFDTLFGILHHVYQSQNIFWFSNIQSQNE